MKSQDQSQCVEAPERENLDNQGRRKLFDSETCLYVK